MRNLVIKGLCLCTLMACMSFFGKKGIDKFYDDKNKFYETYRDVLKKGDFEYAHEKLKELYQGYKTYGLGEHLSDEYYVVCTEIYKEEFKQIILSDDPGMTRKLAFLISEIPDECNLEEGDKEQKYPIDYAKKSIKVTNDICDYVVSMAITLGNQELALAALKWYKKDLIDKSLDTSTTTTIYRLVTFQYKSRDAAKKKIDEAIANGML